MKRQPLFDEYEAALLLDGYLAILRGKSRKETIEKVSRSLRRMAENQGRVIDDSYRNIQGITGQMAALECAWTGGREGAAKTTRLFRAIVCFYRTDPDSFEELLQEAKERSREPEENPPKVAEKEELDMESFAPSTLGRRKKEIIRITITNWPAYSGQGFEEILIIEPNGIRCTTRPFLFPSQENTTQWSYYTESPAFRSLFEEAADKVRKVLAQNYIFDREDVPGREIIITYADHKTEGNDYIRMPEEYKEFAEVVIKMVPKFEEKPELLKFNR